MDLDGGIDGSFWTSVCACTCRVWCLYGSPLSGNAHLLWDCLMGCWEQVLGQSEPKGGLTRGDISLVAFAPGTRRKQQAASEGDSAVLLMSFMGITPCSGSSETRLSLFPSFLDRLPCFRFFCVG
eukprot:RCo012573